MTGRLEREIGARVVVTSGAVWRGERRQGLRQLSNAEFDRVTVPITLYDPGAAGSTLLASGPGPAIQLQELPPDVVGPPGVGVRNAPRSSSDYLTWDVTATRRVGGRWSFNASVAHTWNREHEAAYVGQPVRANEYPLTPNDLINTDPDGRHAFRVWSAKLFGTWEGPWGQTVSWASGSSFLRPLSIVPLGSARLGLKVNWQPYLDSLDNGRNVRFSASRPFYGLEGRSGD